ncbi:MAG: O-antigen ligase family protein [Ignavibacterium sp.]|jgi:O-antigen ligase|nr:O-antigen ligase family protein [Ignavibacterium sp.]
MQKLLTAKNIASYLLLTLLLLNFSVAGISNSTVSALILKILSSSILLAVFFIHIRQNNESLLVFLKSKNIKRLSKILLVIVFYLIVTILYSLNPKYGTHKVINILVSIIPNMLVTYYLITSRSREYLSYFLHIIIAGFLFTLLSIIILQPFDHSTVYQFSPLRWSHVFIARTISFLTLIVFLILLTAKEIKKILFYYLIFIIGFSITYLTGLRSAIIGIIIFSAFGFLWQLLRKRITINHLYSVILMIIFLIALVYIAPEQFETGQRLQNLLRIDDGEFGGDGAILSRIQTYTLSLQMIKDKPILGWGLGSFNGFNNLHWTTLQKYPHNIVLELLSETGAVGLLLFMFVCFLILKNLFNNKYLIFNQSLSIRIFLVITFLFSLFMAMFSKDISTQSFLWLFLIFL